MKTSNPSCSCTRHVVFSTLKSSRPTSFNPFNPPCLNGLIGVHGWMSLWCCHADGYLQSCDLRPYNTYGVALRTQTCQAALCSISTANAHDVDCDIWIMKGWCNVNNTCMVIWLWQMLGVVFVASRSRLWRFFAIEQLRWPSPSPPYTCLQANPSFRHRKNPVCRKLSCFLI